MELVERIKCFLRANPFYKKYCQTKVNDCRYLIRNLRYYYRFYSWKKDKNVQLHTVFFIIDPDISHPGLADRFKAIIGSYYIAKKNGYNFKIIFNHPFALSDYLSCVSEQCFASKEELSYSIQNSRIIAYNGGGKVPSLKKSIKQYHIYCYIGYDILETNKIGNFRHLWGELFQELFTPSPTLKQALLKYDFLQENQFLAVHLRFVNALEQFEGNHFNHLDQNQKENLIQRCINGIKSINIQYPQYQIVIFSDSCTFLSRVQKELSVIVLEGKIGHISFESNNDVVLKTFIDFYMMSKSKRTFRILAPEMYNTVFSYYAALSGGKICEDLHV